MPSRPSAAQDNWRLGVYNDKVDGLIRVPEEDVVAQTHGKLQESLYLDDSDNDPNQGIHRPSTKRQRTGYSCVHCNMTFTEKRALARHKKTDHHRKQIGLPPDRRHACHVCGKYFTRGHDLKRHASEQHPETNGSDIKDFSSAASEGSSEMASSDDFPRAVRSASNASSSTGHTPIATIIEAQSMPMRFDGQDVVECAYTGLPNDELDFLGDGSLTKSPVGKARGLHGRILHSANPVATAKRLNKTPVTPDDERPLVPSLSTSDTSSPHQRTESSSGRSVKSETSGSRPSQPPSLRKSVLLKQLQDQPRVAGDWDPAWCVFCGDVFEDEPDELLKHLRRHMDISKAKHRCKECQLDFVHTEDLSRHLQAAAKGHCGFSFPHRCTGHHPPTANDELGRFTDHDRVRLCDRIQHWEQAQLQAYITEINALVEQRKIACNTGRWSDVWRTSPRRGSFASFAISVNSYATAPCDGTDSNYDVGGLQKRLLQMSLGSTKSKVQKLMNPSGPSLRSNTADRSLQRAVKHSDVLRAEKLIDLGADPNVIHTDKGPFMAMALWGHGYVASRLSDHRFSEDLIGQCETCCIKSGAFEKGLHKTLALLRHKADPNQAGGFCGYPIITAAWMGKPELIRLLISFGANVKQCGGKFTNALCAVASQAGYGSHTEVIRMLIDRGVLQHVSEALDLARQRRDFWVMKLMEMSTPDEDIKGRVPECDRSIRLLEAVLPLKNGQDTRMGGMTSYDYIKIGS